MILSPFGASGGSGSQKWCGRPGVYSRRSETLKLELAGAYMRFTWLQIVVLATSAFGQTSTYPYYLKSFAGTFPLGDGGPATSALLYYPNAAVADPAGNLYILDSNNYRIRKVTTDGKIETYAQSNITAYDMKLAADGSLYIGASGQVLRFTQAGFGGSIAGTGKPGYGGDGGPANGAQVGSVYGIALDSWGSLRGRRRTRKRRAGGLGVRNSPGQFGKFLLYRFIFLREPRTNGHHKWDNPDDRGYC